MCGEDAARHAGRLEKRETQQHRIAHARPDGLAHVLVKGYVLDKDSINCDADYDQKRLERECQEAAQIILPHAAPFAAHHRRHGDGGDRGREVNFQHTPINDDENADGNSPCSDADEQALEPQPEQWA